MDDNKPHRGKLSGYLYIGWEEAEYDGDKIIAYSAQPYAGDTQYHPELEKMIEFRDGQLKIRDVSSPYDSKWDAVWEEDDIECVMDRIEKFSVAEISCKSLQQLVIPGSCECICSGALKNAYSLQIIILLNEKTLMADDEALERIFVNVFDCCSDDYEYDYEYDNAWRTRELNQIMNQKFCAGTLMSGTILLKLSGQTNSQLHKIPVNEEFDIIRDTSGEMNPMRIIFRRKNTHDFIGVLVHTLAYKFAYLMDEGYLKFSNAVYMGKRLVKANVQLTCAGVNDESWLTYRQKDIKNGYDCGYILGNIYEPGNRISYLLGMMSRTTLSAISYTNDNCYELNANWHIILKIRNSKIFCKFQGDDEVYILSGREERFALFYINQYRRIFYLPEIKLENGKEV